MAILYTKKESMCKNKDTKRTGFVVIDYVVSLAAGQSVAVES